MSSLLEVLREIELEIHTLETATPRNSATVDRGGLSVVDEGRITVASGGVVHFGEGGAAASSDFDMQEGRGWQIGTERRGSSIFVLNEIPGANLEVTTANSTAEFEKFVITESVATTVSPGEASSVDVKIFHVTDTPGTLKVGERTVPPTRVMKSQKEHWVFSYSGSSASTLTILTDMVGVEARVLRLTVNNAA